MITFFRRKRITRYVSEAEKYISKHYDNSINKSSISSLPQDDGVDVRFSLKEQRDIKPQSQRDDSKRDDDSVDIRFSLPRNDGVGVQYSLKEQRDVKPQSQRDDIKYSRPVREQLEELNDKHDSEAIDREINSRIQNRDMVGLNAALEKAVSQTFVERLISLIDVKDVRDSTVYKAAQIDRRLFSKIMSDPQYKPAKDTAIAIALALQLPLTQANDLLSRAGYTFSHSIKRDVVIEYFFRERIFDLTDINIVLHELGLKPIGR